MCVVAVKKNQLLEGRGGRVEDVRPHLWLSWFAIQPHRRTATKPLSPSKLAGKPRIWPGATVARSAAWDESRYW